MEVCPLASVGAQALTLLFREEIAHWETLHWNYRPNVELISRFITASSLPGFVLCDPAGIAVGYSYFVINGPVGYLGNVYILDRFASTSNYRDLLSKTLDAAFSNGAVRRIECQLFPFNSELTPLFKQHGFEAKPRHLLAMKLGGRSHSAESPTLPDGFVLAGWERCHFDKAATVIFDSYVDSADLSLCSDYQSPEGCRRFLHNLVDQPGCGTFRPDLSYLILESAGDSVCGVLIGSEISPGNAMVPQVSVQRRFQGKGLGSLMIKHLIAGLERTGFRSVSLSVSAANQGASRLYQNLGFVLKKDFHAFIWEKNL